MNQKDFENYSKSNLLSQKYQDLIKNLDNKSKLVIDTVLFRVFDNNLIVNSYKLSKSELKDISKINKYFGYVSNNDLSFSPEMYKYIFPGFSNYETSVFKFHHGLAIIESRISEYLKDKDCIDGGSYQLDSAIIFSTHYPFKNIYSFEIDKLNLNKGLEILKNYYSYIRNIKPIQLGLWSEEAKGNVLGNGEMDSILNVSRDSNQIETIAIDTYRTANKLNIGYIKLDIEGAEYEAIIGAKNTIQEDLPVMSIAIYHNPRDFFEIKPLVESFVPDKYHFYVRKLTPFYNPQEMYLICIPKNLDINIININDLDIYG